MNERIKELKRQAWDFVQHDLETVERDHVVLEQEQRAMVDAKFAELILADLADELLDVARGSKKTNPEWANGVNHAAMLAQRMTMNLPKEEK